MVVFNFIPEARHVLCCLPYRMGISILLGLAVLLEMPANLLFVYFIKDFERLPKCIVTYMYVVGFVLISIEMLSVCCLCTFPSRITSEFLVVFSFLRIVCLIAVVALLGASLKLFVVIGYVVLMLLWAYICFLANSFYPKDYQQSKNKCLHNVASHVEEGLDSLNKKKPERKENYRASNPVVYSCASLMTSIENASFFWMDKAAKSKNVRNYRSLKRDKVELIKNGNKICLTPKTGSPEYISESGTSKECAFVNILDQSANSSAPNEYWKNLKSDKSQKLIKLDKAIKFSKSHDNIKDDKQGHAMKCKKLVKCVKCSKRISWLYWLSGKHNKFRNFSKSGRKRFTQNLGVQCKKSNKDKFCGYEVPRIVSEVYESCGSSEDFMNALKAQPKRSCCCSSHRPPVRCPKPEPEICPKPSKVKCPKPSKEKCPKPPKVVSPKPSKEKCPKPPKVVSPKPSKEKCPKPPKLICPKPSKQKKPKASKIKCPKPSKEKPPKPPKKVKSPKPSKEKCPKPPKAPKPPKPPKEICPKPSKEICPKPPKEICPKPPKEICPKPPKEICPKPPKVKSPKPSKVKCPKPSKVKCPKPSKEKHPKPPKEKCPKPKNEKKKYSSSTSSSSSCSCSIQSYKSGNSSTSSSSSSGKKSAKPPKLPKQKKGKKDKSSSSSSGSLSKYSSPNMKESKVTFSKNSSSSSSSCSSFKAVKSKAKPICNPPKLSVPKMEYSSKKKKRAVKHRLICIGPVNDSRQKVNVQLKIEIDEPDCPPQLECGGECQPKPKCIDAPECECDMPKPSQVCKTTKTKPVKKPSKPIVSSKSCSCMSLPDLSCKKTQKETQYDCGIPAPKKTSQKGCDTKAEVGIQKCSHECQCAKPDVCPPSGIKLSNKKKEKGNSNSCTCIICLGDCKPPVCKMSNKCLSADIKKKQNTECGSDLPSTHSNSKLSPQSSPTKKITIAKSSCGCSDFAPAKLGSKMGGQRLDLQPSKTKSNKSPKSSKSSKTDPCSKSPSAKSSKEVKCKIKKVKSAKCKIKKIKSMCKIKKVKSSKRDWCQGIQSISKNLKNITNMGIQCGMGSTCGVVAPCLMDKQCGKDADPGVAVQCARSSVVRRNKLVPTKTYDNFGKDECHAYSSCYNRTSLDEVALHEGIDLTTLCSHDRSRERMCYAVLDQDDGNDGKNKINEHSESRVRSDVQDLKNAVMGDWSNKGAIAKVHETEACAPRKENQGYIKPHGFPTTYFTSKILRKNKDKSLINAIHRLHLVSWAPRDEEPQRRPKSGSSEKQATNTTNQT